MFAVSTFVFDNIARLFSNRQSEGDEVSIPRDDGFIMEHRVVHHGKKILDGPQVPFIMDSLYIASGRMWAM